MDRLVTRVSVAACLLLALTTTLVLLNGVMAAPAIRQGDLPGECSLTADYRALSQTVARGDEVALELMLRSSCTTAERPINVVLLIDTSDDIAEETFDQALTDSVEFVGWLDLESNEDVKVGVVPFNADVGDACPLTNDPVHVDECVLGLERGPGTRLDLGLSAALTMLLADRETGVGDDGRTEVVIVVSDGRNEPDCASLREVAMQVRGTGILTFAQCVGDCDRACMLSVVGTPRYLLDFEGIYSRLGQSGLPVSAPPVEAVVSGRLAPGVTMVPGSWNVPGEFLFLGQDWSWRPELISTEAMTVTYRVTVNTEPGERALSENAVARVRGYSAAPGDGPWFEVDLPIPMVTVSGATNTPGPMESGTPPPHTGTPPPETGTATPETVTATRGPVHEWQIYLPAAYWLRGTVGSGSVGSGIL